MIISNDKLICKYNNLSSIKQCGLSELFFIDLNISLTEIYKENKLINFINNKDYEFKYLIKEMTITQFHNSKSFSKYNKKNYNDYYENIPDNHMFFFIQMILPNNLKFISIDEFKNINLFTFSIYYKEIDLHINKNYYYLIDEDTYMILLLINPTIFSLTKNGGYFIFFD